MLAEKLKRLVDKYKNVWVSEDDKVFIHQSLADRYQRISGISVKKVEVEVEVVKEEIKEQLTKKPRRKSKK